MHREASQKIPDIERDAQAGSEPSQSQFPPGNIAGIRSRSVVAILERGNLRFGIARYTPIHRVQSFCNVIVNPQCSVQKPLLRWRVHVSTNTNAAERLLRQEKSGAGQGCQSASPKKQKVAPALITQALGSYLNCGERSLCKEAVWLFHGERFYFRFHARRRDVYCAQ